MRFCPTCGLRLEVEFCPEDGTATVPLEEEPDVDPLLGRVVDGRYRIDRQIGEGGMGIVYLATHTVLNKKLALKVLRGDMAKNTETVQRFIQEAQSASAIGHQNIIDISDFGRLPDGSAYFVMEYLDGLPLTDLIARGGSVPMRDAISILIQMTSALGAAHQRGIVHRDLKPDNIFLIRRGEDEHFVKVLDFGIAKVGGAGSKLTKTGMVFGTPQYMSPEQAAGQAVDARTDIYALGVIMYEMFTGYVPFDADTFMGILSKHMFEPPLNPSESNPQLGALGDVILKTLAKKPENRYANAEELIADLRSFSVDGSVRLGDSGQVPLADALEPPSRTEANLVPQGLRPNRWPLVLLMGLAAIGLVTVLVFGAVVAPSWFSDPISAEEETPRSDAGLGREEAADAALGTVVPTVEVQDGSTAEAGAADVPETKQVQVESEPAGAQVLEDGVILGNTPLSVEASAVRELTVSLPGFEAARVRVSEESPERLAVTLQRTRRTPRPRRVTPPRTPPPMIPPVMTPPPRMRRTPDDVVDPWSLK